MPKQYNVQRECEFALDAFDLSQVDCQPAAHAEVAHKTGEWQRDRRDKLKKQGVRVGERADSWNSGGFTPLGGGHMSSGLSLM